MKLTKKQIKELNKAKQKNETETLYICNKCNERLKGMIEVRKHIKKFKHYAYRCYGKGTIMFA